MSNDRDGLSPRNGRAAWRRDEGESTASLDETDIPELEDIDDRPVSWRDDGHETPVDALVEELRTRNLDADERQVIRDALDVEATANRDARLRRLEPQVALLAAYGDDLEAFLDLCGDVTDDIDDLHATVDRLESRLTRLEDRLEPDDES